MFFKKLNNEKIIMNYILKNNILILLTISFFFISCSKDCVDCGSCPEEVTLTESELCQDDFDSVDDYDAAVALIEALGCDCQ